MSQGRNELCQCGSGKKFKHCCGDAKRAIPAASAAPQASLAEAFGRIAECLNTGRYAEAESLSQRILPLAPNNPDAFYLAGLAARCLGQAPLAVERLNRAVQLKPQEASFHCGLGIALNEAGQPQAGMAALARALQLQPQYAEAWNNLGYLHLQAERYAEAATHFQRAVAAEPRMAEAHYNLGCAQDGLGQHAAAEAAYRQALSLHPQYVDALNNLSVALRRRGQLAEAIACCHQATTLAPQNARCHYNLGALLFEHGAAAEAIAYCSRAIALQADFADAYATLASAQSAQGQTDAALLNAQRAIELAPENAEHHLALAYIHEKRNEHAAALACYQALQARWPEALEYRVRELATRLPRQVDAAEAIPRIRRQLAEGIDALLQAEGHITRPEQAAFTLFSLAYHGQDDKALLERAAALIQAKFPALHRGALPARPAGRARIHVGILSSRLHHHSIGKLNIGYIRHLDRSRFHVSVIHGPGSVVDAMSAQIDQLADQVLYLPHDLVQAQQQVIALGLDILHYPDIGMVPPQSLLAHARLAPVQTTSWGHPSTTGAGTIDYFISMDAAEPPHAQAHYTERLVRFQHPPACFDAPPPAAALDRATLGLPTEGRLYGCLQTLIKFHPDFDAVLDELLQRDPTAWLIAIEDAGGQLAQQLRTRWAAQHPQLAARTVFVPQQSSEAFLALMGQMDMLLDPPHFGSGVSFYESVAQAVPTLTWPGEHLRGRLVAGFYQWLGIEDAPIVPTLADYAATAVAYAQDRARLDALKNQLRTKGPALFNNLAAVRELEDFFTRVHQGA